MSDGSGFGENVITFGADMSLSVHIDKRKKDILILGKVIYLLMVLKFKTKDSEINAAPFCLMLFQKIFQLII